MKVGDLVRLNRQGLRQINGLQTPEQVDAQVNGVRVIGVEAVACSDPEPLYAVEVDGPFGCFILTDRDLEEIHP